MNYEHEDSKVQEDERGNVCVTLMVRKESLNS